MISFPRYRKDSDLIKRVQGRATKMIPTLKNTTYEERLRKRELSSLYYCRERGNMVECYKVTPENYDMQTIFNFDSKERE